MNNFSIEEKQLWINNDLTQNLIKQINEYIYDCYAKILGNARCQTQHGVPYQAAMGDLIGRTNAYQHIVNIITEIQQEANND